MKLLALLCPHCGQPLPAENEDVVVECRHCRTASAIREDGLEGQRVRYLAAEPGSQPDRWLPLWTYLGRLTLQRRETQGGSRHAGREAAAFWAEPRRFYVPAWEISLKLAKKMGSQLLMEQPAFHPIDPPPGQIMASATVSLEDAGKLLDLIIVSIEAGRNDYLKTLEYTLDLGPPELWALPAIQKNQQWHPVPLRQ